MPVLGILLKIPEVSVWIEKPFEYPPHIAVGRRVQYAGNNTSELVKKAIKLYDERIASIELAEKKH